MDNVAVMGHRKSTFGKGRDAIVFCGHKHLEEVFSKIPQDQPEIIEHVRLLLANDSGPSLPDKAKHWAAAVVRWCAAGCPVRSKELQEACRLTCQGCPSDQFDPKKEACKVCGCSVKKSRFAIRDKVAMATEVCHKDHWPKQPNA